MVQTCTRCKYLYPRDAFYRHHDGVLLGKHVGGDIAVRVVVCEPGQPAGAPG
jgi:hypothetical protein